MAQQLRFKPRDPPSSGDFPQKRHPERPADARHLDGRSATEAGAELLLALHESGILRTLAGFAGKFGEVTDIALDEAASDPGRNAIGSLLLLAQLLCKIPAGDLTALGRGFEQGLLKVRNASNRKPRGTLGLLNLMRSEDTRRGIEALLLMVSALGAELAKSRSAKS